MMTINIVDQAKKKTPVITQMENLKTGVPFIANHKSFGRVFGVVSPVGDKLVFVDSGGRWDAFSRDANPSFEDVQYVEVKNIDVTLLN